MSAGRPPTDDGPLLEARGVALSFGTTPALRGADVSVTGGEILAVMGPSGSGKSTLLHCLAGILVPDIGEIRFAGARLDSRSEGERSALRRDRFGFVFQFGQLVPELTTQENVALPLLLGGVRRAEALAQAAGWFDRLELDGLQHRRSGELSGGQAQRVALARGLVARPQVLFADEPTGSLDSLTGERVMDLLSSAAREQGTTVILVTHEPRVAAYADREVIVRDGKVTSLSGDRVVGVIRLGLRLAVAGGREAITRLALIAIAVAIGTGLLLTTLASLNAVNAQNARYAWLETAYTGSNAPATGSTDSATAHDPLWWRLRADYYQGKEIGRVDLAATGPNSPIPPGISALPGPGQYYASPALATLLRRTPSAQLGDRYPGTLIGTIGAAALPAPNSLVIVIGRSVAELSHDGGADLVDRISTTVPSSCAGDCALGVGYDSNGITLILSVVAAALLFPVLIFIGGATRLSATRREHRFAAMRLVGATPRQISVISTVESAVATAIGVAAGFGLFYALRPAIATIPFTGDPFFAGDLYLNLADVLLVALGIPIAAAVAARLALRRVTISPLGVTRRVTPSAPRAWRVLPLLAGLAELGYFAYVHDIGTGTHTSTTVEAAAFLIGVLLVMAGLVIAGPWLTMLISRVTARRAHRPATLIAARRLSDNPQAGFRAISGLVLAVFVGTCAIGIITAIAATGGSSPTDSALSKATVVDMFGPVERTGTVTSIPSDTTSRLTSISGVTGLLLIRNRTNPDPPPFPSPIGTQRRPADPPRNVRYDPIQELVSCAQLAAVPALGRCRPGAEVAVIEPDYGGGFIDRASMADTTWPAVDLSGSGLDRLPIDTLVVGTNGSIAAVEQARGTLDAAFPSTFAPQTMAELGAQNSRELDGYRQLANVVILTSLPIAGCSLAVNIAGGLAERKRPFSLLRLTGAPLAMLRRVITLEAAAPLLITAVASVGAGLLTAQLFLRAQLHQTLLAPGAQYYVVLAAGLLASLAVIASTLPLLRRLTGPEIARNE